MDIKTIIGFGLMAYYFLQRTNKLQDQIDKNTADDERREEDYQNDKKETDPKNLAEKYLSVTTYFWTRETGGTKWSASFTWKVKNTSTDKAFIIRAIRSTFWMSNGITASYQPMKQNLSVVVNPGKEVTIQMADDIESWFNTSNDCKRVRNEVLSKCEGKTENYKQLMTSNTQIMVDGDFYSGNLIADFPNNKGYVWRDTSAARYFGNSYGGENGVNANW